MECLLDEYLQKKVKGLPNVDGPRTPNILLDIVFPVYSMLLVKIDIFTSLLKKLTMRMHLSYLPFNYNSQEKQFLKGILVRKSHCIMIKSKLMEFLLLTERLCEKKQQFSRYIFLQKASS